MKCLRTVNLKFQGISRYLPVVCARRKEESDAYTPRRSITTAIKNGYNCKTDSNNEGNMANSNDNARDLGYEKSEEAFRQWGNYWKNIDADKNIGIVNQTLGETTDWSNGVNSEDESKGDTQKRRYIMAMRHGERVDLTYGQWVPHCFDESGKYVRKDLNLPIKLPDRVGGKESFARDTPLTRVGRLQGYLVGEALRLAGVPVKHVYASSAYRCVETAQAFLEGLQGDPAMKIKVEPGIFEHKMWHMVDGAMVPFMTPLELHKAGYQVDLDYKPYVHVDSTTPESLEEYYKRNEKVMQSVVKATEAEGGNIMFVAHAATLDMMVTSLSRMRNNKADYPPYKLPLNLLKVPYCAVAAMKDNPLEVVAPPCPPAMNSCSGRFNWKILTDGVC